MINLVWMFLVLFTQMAYGQGAAQVKALSYEEVLEKILEASPELKSTKAEVGAQQIAYDRASRHWAPKLTLDGRIYNTNDPGMSLFGKLGQREVGALDFAPQSINQPTRDWYGNGGITLDMPLFEGMRSSSIAQAEYAALGAAQHGQVAKLREIKAKTATHYTALLVAQRELSELQALKIHVRITIDKYSIGAKSNLVGYSGLLGLKTLANRIDVVTSAVELKKLEAMHSLRAMAEDNQLPDFMASATSVEAHIKAAFNNTLKDKLSNALNNALNNAETASSMEGSPLVNASLKQSIAAEKAIAAERARYMPRVGLFADGRLYGGEKNTAPALTAGAYLQWSIFNATDFGAAAQASLKAQSATARFNAAAQNAKHAHRVMVEQAKTMWSNLERLNESSTFLEEQTNAAKRLFVAGSINALQLVELWSRRVDLISARSETAVALAQVLSQQSALAPENNEEQKQSNVEIENKGITYGSF